MKKAKKATATTTVKNQKMTMMILKSYEVKIQLYILY